MLDVAVGRFASALLAFTRGVVFHLNQEPQAMSRGHAWIRFRRRVA